MSITDSSLSSLCGQDLSKLATSTTTLTRSSPLPRYMFYSHNTAYADIIFVVVFEPCENTLVTIVGKEPVVFKLRDVLTLFEDSHDKNGDLRPIDCVNVMSGV